MYWYAKFKLLAIIIEYPVNVIECQTFLLPAC